MKLFKKLGVLLTAATLFVTSLTVIPLNVNAKEPYMKEAGVRWNLEPDKEVNFQTKYSVYGYTNIKAKIKNFKIEVHEKFCKLIGSKEDLEKIITKYEIDYPILYHNEEYSVAFNGALFRKIKENYKDIIK